MNIKSFLQTITSVIKMDGIVEDEVDKVKKIVVMSSHTPSLFWFRMDMMKCFIDYGYTVYALGNEPEDKWEDRFLENNIIYRQIDVKRNSTNPISDFKTLLSIKNKLKEIRPDKIFTYQAKTVIYGGIAAGLLGIREIYTLIAGIGSVFLKNDIKTKLIRKIMIMEYKLGMRKSQTVFFQNHDDEREFRTQGIIKNQKTMIIPGSGVNSTYFSLLPLPETVGFLCISRLIRDKGVYEYLEACKKIKIEYPQIRCLLVGPYDSNPSAMKSEELDDFVKNNIVEYFGEQEDVRPYLAQSSVFVLPSYREGTPKTNLEAMACGRAIITTDAPGCRETVRDGENGFMVPVKNVEMLYDRMKYFIENPEVISEMGIAGRKRVEEYFDVKIVNEYICQGMNLNKEKFN